MKAHGIDFAERFNSGTKRGLGKNYSDEFINSILEDNVNIGGCEGVTDDKVSVTCWLQSLEDPENPLVGTTKELLKIIES